MTVFYRVFKKKSVHKGLIILIFNDYIVRISSKYCISAIK